MIRGRTRRKTMKCPRLDPIGSHPRKTKITPIKQWSSTAHAPPGGEQHDPTLHSVAALLTYKLKNGETPLLAVAHVNVVEVFGTDDPYTILNFPSARQSFESAQSATG